MASRKWLHDDGGTMPARAADDGSRAKRWRDAERRGKQRGGRAAAARAMAAIPAAARHDNELRRDR
ncbi:hypothetical protein Scep_027901 [Stephania cephalantha]|uniref:Uncharacterized protein n=1 Tax=Stephania cephalantha TaxID=152367 RepID=A0AAP0E8W2_9MAGN